MSSTELNKTTTEELAALEEAFVERDIEVITEEINFFKRQAGCAVLEIGKRLAEAKAQLSHGEWLPWLEREVSFSERSAQQYMRLWKEYGKSAIVADLGAAKALSLLALPEVEREAFAAETHTVNGEEKTAAEMTRRELEKVIAERDDARKRTIEYAAEADGARGEAERLEAELKAAHKELEELRSRPTEVAVEQINASEEQLDEARREGAKAAEKLAEERNARIAELERRLEDAEKRRDAALAAEKDLQREKDEALQAAGSFKAEAEAARKRAAAASHEGMERFKVLFDQTVENVNRMHELLAEQTDSEQEKLRRAMAALAEQIRRVDGNG